MRKLASLIAVAALAAGLVLAAAGPSAASVGTKTTRFCRAVKSFDTDDIGNPTSESGAAKSLKGLRRLERVATKNLKRSMGTIVDAYEQVADGKSARKAFADRDFVKAFGTFVLATGKCLVDDIT